MVCVRREFRYIDVLHINGGMFSGIVDDQVLRIIWNTVRG